MRNEFEWQKEMLESHAWLAYLIGIMGGFGGGMFFAILFMGGII